MSNSRLHAFNRPRSDPFSGLAASIILQAKKDYERNPKRVKGEIMTLVRRQGFRTLRASCAHYFWSAEFEHHAVLAGFDPEVIRKKLKVRKPKPHKPKAVESGS